MEGGATGCRARAHCRLLGMCGAAVQPGRKIPDELLKAWADRIGREQDYGKVTQTEEEGRLIDESGRLLIDWPKLVDTGEPVPLDLLLVTANDPQINTSRPNYPDAATIAGAWNVAATIYVEYFLEECRKRHMHLRG